MREWAHRLWSSSVNSGAMTSQSTSAEHDRNTSGRAAIVLATSARSDARVDMGIKVDYLPPSEPRTAGQPRFCERSPCPGWAAVGAGAPVRGWVHARDSIRARRPISVEAPDGAGGLDHSAGPPAARALSVTFSFNKLLEFILARSERGLRPIHLARRVDPDTTPRTSIADVVPDRARALGVDQGAGLHRPPGRRPRAWWTRRHRVSARRA